MDMKSIICPGCGNEVNGEAAFCPQCGQQLFPQGVEPVQPAAEAMEPAEPAAAEATEPVAAEPAGAEETSLASEMVCGGCGAPVLEGAEACSNCGGTIFYPQNQPVTVMNGNQPIYRRKSFWIVIAAAIVVLAGLAVGFSIYTAKQEERAAAAAAEAQAAAEQQYYSNLQLTSSTMLDGASKAESAGNLIYNVWHDAIYDKVEAETQKYVAGTSDFNDALKNLFADADFSAQISEIETNQGVVEQFMKDLKNPPEQYRDAYDDVKSYYDAYLTFTNLVVNPTGSLNSFTSSFNEADTKVLNAYKTMQLHFDN